MLKPWFMHHSFFKMLRKSNSYALRSVKLHVTAANPQKETLEITEDDTGKKRHLTYTKTIGPSQPGIIYIPGFMSGKDGNKPIAIDSFCQKNKLSFVRYDPSGLGDSDHEIDLKNARLSHWIEDARHMLLQATEGPQLVIGSSMGAWIACYLAMRHPEKFSQLLLLAPALNFARPYIQKMHEKLPASIIERLKKGESIEYFDPRNPDWGEMPISLSLFEDMLQYEVPLEKGMLPINCPVRIIHGVKDADVPYKNSLKLLDGLASSDVQLTYIKHGDHRISDQNSLEVICDAITKMIHGDIQAKL
ncbi:unnamed protein product [Meganyctiphanes norvegica]|uniref:Serine aminopeptidase S33 domain-containing protein n=1 Tax=Meganyctiphanes norvegica TaxID=48144 RepID=A0AAV2QJT1_MEGNR